jgi:hypothetical protein
MLQHWAGGPEAHAGWTCVPCLPVVVMPPGHLSTYLYRLLLCINCIHYSGSLIIIIVDAHVPADRWAPLFLITAIPLLVTALLLVGGDIPRRSQVSSFCSVTQ